MIYTRNCEIKEGITVPEGMQRIALGVEYHGASYGGFQKQSHTPNTVQALLESAISEVADEPLTLVCAGRTDSGVHASGQVVHFDTLADRPQKAWIQGVNTKLPKDIRVSWAKQVPSHFHARFSAKDRTYRYVFCVSPVSPATLSDGVTWLSQNHNFIAMQQAAQFLIGEHDFSSFRSSQCQARHARREIKYIRFFSSGAFWVMEIKANAFLHHMVRNIVGALLEVGVERQAPNWLLEHRKRKDRSLGPPTASGAGLYLVKVDYPAEFNMPETRTGPCFILNPQQGL